MEGGPAGMHQVVLTVTFYSCPSSSRSSLLLSHHQDFITERRRKKPEVRGKLGAGGGVEEEDEQSVRTCGGKAIVRPIPWPNLVLTLKN